MALPRARRIGQRIRHPHTTVRWRLTLLYGGLFLVSGAALLTVTYLLVVDHKGVTAQPLRALIRGVQTSLPAGTLSPRPGTLSPGPNFVYSPQQTVKALRDFVGSARARQAIVFIGNEQQISDLHQLIEEAGVALAIMALLSMGLGWVVAGRVLRPLRTMTAATQAISASSLDRRLEMPGPRDELRQLADTIDGLLGRLETAFDAQRRFVANASHELRTPLTAARAVLELVMSDPEAGVQSFRGACAQVLEESARQEELIDALLALARGQRGLSRRDPVDLAAVVGRSLERAEPEASLRGIALEAQLGPAVVSGDERLIEQLVANLVENAMRYNVPDGRIGVTVADSEGTARITVTNSGPHVPADEIDRLLQPFQRIGADRVGYGDGVGLGLSIVAAIADAHGARLDLTPRPPGGLDVSVVFPVVASPSEAVPAPSAAGTLERA